MAENWKTWLSPKAAAYGQLFFDRATGVMDEMESSKAAARRVVPHLREGDTILDVGCGAGHYLVSLRKQSPFSFNYIGVDATPAYIELGRQAFHGEQAVSFREADVFALPFEDASVEVVMCNNVLLHLPSVAKPLSELMRVASRRVLIRTLVGENSMAVRNVDPAEDGDEFDEQGLPRSFHFMNIYSERYLRRLIERAHRYQEVRLELDRDFEASRLADTSKALPHAWNATRAVNGSQIAGNLVLPWTWVDIALG